MPDASSSATAISGSGPINFGEETTGISAPWIVGIVVVVVVGVVVWLLKRKS
jgi:hypothetical protein